MSEDQADIVIEKPSMMYFGMYEDGDGKRQVVGFYTQEQLFSWMQQEHNSGGIPKKLALFKGECLLDLS